MANLRLNILPIVEKEFFFNAYRKIKQENDTKEDGLYFYQLRKDSGDTEKINYWVSIKFKEGFEPFVANSHDSIGLTKHFLLSALETKMLSYIHDIPFSVVRKSFAERIEFTIEEFSKGKQLIFMSPYYFEEQKKFGFIIDFRFSRNKGATFDKQVQILSLSLDKQGRSNRNYYSDKYNLIQLFLERTHNDIHKLTFDKSESIHIAREMIETSVFLLNKKEYIFSNKSTANSQFQGIKNYGPFEKLSKEVIFVFIFEEKFKAFANELYLSLVGRSNPGTFPGFEAMFGIKLNVQNVRQIKLNSYSKDELLNIVNSVKSIQDSNSDKKVIGIYIEDYLNEDDDLSVSDHYYFLKYNFIKRDIPLQVVNYRKLGERNSLKWSTSNIALAMFAKMGGKPWIVKPSNANCLILGIGSSHRKNSTTGEISKYFAYSVCLDSSGLYRTLEVLADETSEESYLTTLQTNLVKLLKDDRIGTYKMCVLHLPFKIKGSEIKAISAAINQIRDIEFVTIKVNLDNKYFGYSFHNTLVPYESSFVKLSRTEYLVWFEGLLYGKEVVDKRLSNPVHIQFLNLGTQTVFDERSYLQDVLNLSGANWRGFNAKSIPISIYYSQIIAKYSEAFENVDGFEDNTISNNNPWFL